MMLKKSFFGLALALMAASVLAGSPDIPLRDMEGKPRNVNEFIGKGKWVIVAAWAHDCRVCESEMPDISGFHMRHKDKDAIVLGVTIDGMELIKEARGFVAKHKLPFPNLVAEPEQEVMMKFGGGSFVGTPTHYMYDPSGRLVARKIGPLPGKDIEEFIEAFNVSPYAKQ